MIEKFSDILKYDNIVPIEFILKSYSFLKEDNEYIPNVTTVPRFTIKGDEDIKDVPINKPIEATQELIIKAIKYGMIFLITYKGAKDTLTSGHERVIYPMVLGRSSVGKLLIRGYHLKGWSVSSNRDIEKIWRMFRFDRIKSITFTGSFYRLPPEGYNMHDKGMRGGIIARADFNEIRRNQQNLLKEKEIQNIEDIKLNPKEKDKPVTVIVDETNTQMDLMNPYENEILEKLKDDANLRITFLKSINNSDYYAILGALGKPGNIVKIKNSSDKLLGTFKVLDSIGGEVLKIIKNVKGNKIFDLFIFKEKVN